MSWVDREDSPVSEDMKLRMLYLVALSQALRRCATSRESSASVIAAVQALRSRPSVPPCKMSSRSGHDHGSLSQKTGARHGRENVRAAPASSSSRAPLSPIDHNRNNSTIAGLRLKRQVSVNKSQVCCRSSRSCLVHSRVAEQRTTSDANHHFVCGETNDDVCLMTRKRDCVACRHKWNERQAAHATISHKHPPPRSARHDQSSASQIHSGALVPAKRHGSCHDKKREAGQESAVAVPPVATKQLRFCDEQYRIKLVPAPHSRQAFCPAS